MKKITKVFVVVCLLIALVTTLVACSTSGTLGKDEQGRFKLAVPEVTLNNNSLSWKEVRYCTSYGVVVNDGKEEIISKTSYTLLGDEDAKVKVRAIGDNIKTVSSPYSKVVEYKAKDRLANPQAPTIKEQTDSKLVLEWNAIKNAKSYEILQTLSIEQSEGNEKKYTSTTNTLTIDKKELKNPNVYNFKVKALSDSKDIIDSNYSENLAYYVSEKLADPAPKYAEDGKLNWEKVENAGKYAIYLKRVSDNEFKLVEKTTKTEYYKDGINQLVQKYNDLIDSKDLQGEYEIAVQAINEEYSEVYLSSGLATVVKVDGSKITFKKAGEIKNIKLVDNTLTWDAVDGFKEYIVEFTSGEQTTRFNEEKNQSILSERFNETSNKEYAGKVLNITIKVASDSKNGVLEGVATQVKNGDKLAEYCFIPDKLETVASGEYAGYLKINDTGSLAYLLSGKDTKANYWFEKDIDCKNANIYAGSAKLEGIVVGNNKVVTNLNLIEKDNATKISLFDEITATGQIKNLNFTKITYTSERKDIASIALLAQTNNGLVEFVNFANCKIENPTKIAGLVVQNNKNINSSSFIASNIVGGDKVAGIALINDGEIYNASVYNVSLNASSKDKDVLVAGIACENNKNISNSFVRTSVVLAKTFAETVQCSSVAGGLVAVNGGNLKECYVEHNGETSKSVEAITDATRQFARNSIAGGLIGKNIAGSIKSCYVVRAKIVADKYASGMVGIKESGTLQINDCFVFSVSFQATNKAIVTKGSEGVDSKNVYFVDTMFDYTNLNTDNAKSVGRAELKNQNLEGFVNFIGHSTEHPVLKNMLYANKYTVEYNKNATREIKVYLGANNQTEIIAPKFECDLKTSGFKVDVYASTIENDKLIVLPIYVSVK